jgi:periplasmic copper chaperone A
MVTGRNLIPSRNVRFALSPRKALVTLQSRAKDWHFRPISVCRSLRFQILVTERSSLGSAIGMVSPALLRLSPSDAGTCSALWRSFTHYAYGEAMRTLSKLALAALLIGFVTPTLAQGTGNTSITVEQPWARATPGSAKNGAVYMTLDNKSGTADRLTGASSDVAEKSQIHEMKVENGVMKMREIAGGLPIPAGGSVVFKPGSYHVMLVGLKKPLTIGEKFPLTLTFEKAGNISVTVPVQAMDATQDKGGMGGMQDKSGGGMGHMEMK